MSTISSYVLRQTTWPLLATVVLALLVLLTERMLRLLDLVLDSRGSLTALLRMLAYLTPHYMSLALPVAFFLGILLTFSGLQQRSELDALCSAGIGLHRLIKPVLALAVFLTLLSAVNFGWAQPFARYTYRALVHAITEASLNIYLQERTFMQVGDATFMADRVQRGGRQFAGVFIYQDDGEGTSSVTSAQRGRLVQPQDSDQSILVLDSGVRLRTQAADASSERGTGLLVFERFQMPIDLTEKRQFRSRGEDERELTLPELWSQRDQPPLGITTAQMLAEMNDRLVRICSVIFLPFLAVPFAIGQRRIHSAYGIVSGLVTLILYNEVLTVGKSMASVERISPLIGHWAPLVLFAAGSIYFFRRSAFLVPGGGTLPLERLEGLARGLIDSIAAARRQQP